ncbi:MAG: DegV family protein [Chloroflexota bacterium]|nr:DegV family protein [Chloroflexota bacterium]
MMKKVALVTDSTACIPPEIARDLDITVVPIWVLFGEQAYRDGVDITPDEFYARLKTADPLPHTSSPSPGDYLKVFENLRQEADSILVITYSSHFGMSYQAARIAGDQIEGVRVEVLDSRTATMAQGFVAIIAARAIARGADLESAISVAEQTIPCVGFLAKLETLHYLSKSGRVPEIADWIGRALSLRLIFGSGDGVVSVVGASRTQRQAINQILDELVERTMLKKLDVGIFHADAPDEAERLRDRLLKQFEVDELYLTEMTPVIGAHIGPGVVGLAYCLDNPEYNP